MGRKVIFDLADIRRHCVDSTCVDSVFIGNLEKKIKIDANKESVGDSEKQRQATTGSKKRGKNQVVKKSKKRKASKDNYKSSESGSETSSEGEESTRCSTDPKSRDQGRAIGSSGEFSRFKEGGGSGDSGSSSSESGSGSSDSDST